MPANLIDSINNDNLPQVVLSSFFEDLFELLVDGAVMAVLEVFIMPALFLGGEEVYDPGQKVSIQDTCWTATHTMVQYSYTSLKRHMQLVNQHYQWQTVSLL